MLAHVNPVLILGFLGCVVLGNVAALVATVGSFVSHRRRLWIVGSSWFAIALGVSASGMYFNDGGGWHWTLALCLAPVILGVISLIRIRSLRAWAHCLEVVPAADRLPIPSIALALAKHSGLKCLANPCQTLYLRVRQRSPVR